MNALLASEILSSGPRAGFYVPVRDFLSKIFDVSTVNQTTSSTTPAAVKTKILAAMITGTMGSIIANPVDVVKIRLMADPNLYSSTINGLRAIYQNEGNIVKTNLAFLTFVSRNFHCCRRCGSLQRSRPINPPWCLHRIR